MNQEAKISLGPRSTMEQVLEAYPGSRRALFRRYHIGGCSSCGFQPDETLEEVLRRHNVAGVEEVIEHIRTSHEQDARILLEPKELAEMLRDGDPIKLLDVRSRPEFNAVQLPGSILMSQPVMQEILGQWPRDQVIVIIDHKGGQGLDAAAYFLGHGFPRVRCLRGGIDAWADEVDSNVRRYELA